MDEEIKEILNNLRYTAKEHIIQVLENGGMIEHCPQQILTEMRLNSYSAKILLDYITNLQQENGNLKTNEQINVEVHNKQVEIIKDYKSRCEKAIELYKNCKEEDYCILSLNMYEVLNGSDENETNS